MIREIRPSESDEHTAAHLWLFEQKKKVCFTLTNKQGMFLFISDFSCDVYLQSSVLESVPMWRPMLEKVGKLLEL